MSYSTALYQNGKKTHLILKRFPLLNHSLRQSPFLLRQNHSISEILNNKTTPASIEENSQRYKTKYIFTNKDLFKKVNL